MNAVMNTEIQQRMERAAERADKAAKWIARNQGALTLGLGIMAVGLMLMPETAFAQDIAGKGQKALDWIKKAVYFILVVAVIGAGVLAAFGRMSWATVGQVLIGSIVAGVAAEVVTALYGGG